MVKGNQIAIGYCKIQRSLSKTVKFLSFELQQGLFSLFSSALQEIAYGRPIDFITLFRMARRVFSEGGLMYRYDMLATPQGTLRPDLALARKQRCEMNAAELNTSASCRLRNDCVMDHYAANTQTCFTA